MLFNFIKLKYKTIKLLVIVCYFYNLHVQTCFWLFVFLLLLFFNQFSLESI